MFQWNAPLELGGNNAVFSTDGALLRSTGLVLQLLIAFGEMESVQTSPYLQILIAFGEMDFFYPVSTMLQILIAFGEMDFLLTYFYKS
jgi:hypothetical protein